MNNENVLVVGAGALGITCARYLQNSGANISFYVRPHRVEQLNGPIKLFSYSDHAVQLLENYEVLSKPEELAGKSYDYIMLTLDGATCRSEQGTQTLRALGTALANSSARLVINGVGIGLYDYIRETTGFPDDRLLQGTMAIYAYQVDRPDTPLPAAEDRELHDSSDIAYYQFSEHGFMLSNKPKKAVKDFVELFERSGDIKCRAVPDVLYRMFTSMFFAFSVGSEVDGWRGSQALIESGDVWPLICEAQREIMRLKEFGLAGKLMALITKDSTAAKRTLENESASPLIDVTAFNRFHHGGKVLAQDVQVLENCVAAGKSQGRNMPATNELLNRWRALQS